MMDGKSDGQEDEVMDGKSDGQEDEEDNASESSDAVVEIPIVARTALVCVSSDDDATTPATPAKHSHKVDIDEVLARMEAKLFGTPEKAQVDIKIIISYLLNNVLLLFWYYTYSFHINSHIYLHTLCAYVFVARCPFPKQNTIRLRIQMLVVGSEGKRIAPRVRLCWLHALPMTSWMAWWQQWRRRLCP